MLQNYRKRFVLLNMLLIGVVLITVFVSLFYYMCRRDYNELENTLRMMVEPLGRFGDSYKRLEEADPGFPEKKEGERQKRQGLTASDAEDRGVTTAFYDTDTRELSVVVDGADIEEDVLEEAVTAIADSTAQFGKLKGYGLIYFRERAGSLIRVSIVSDSYYMNGVFNNLLGIILAFVVAMALFCLISVWLSKLAAKPMEDAIEMERQFVADISHDLKTPITVILANNSILNSRPEATVAEQSQWIDSTQTAAKNMMDMVSEMLTLSSLESADKTLEPVRVDLSSAAEKTVLQLESVAYDRGVSVESDTQEGIFVNGRVEHVERICSGLLENALKYEPSGGKTGLTLRTERKKAVLRVSNCRSVISREDMGHIFERFYRSDKVRSSESGHGLGLPIIKRITELMGAEISVESSPETGTVFTVVFDLAE